jgi:Kef-type K+ transport system membrane component KefB
MPDLEFSNLLGVLAVAFAVPFLLGLVPRVRIPAVVVEIVAGIVLGPSGLGLIHVDLGVQVVALLGLAMLLFLAGLEIDPRELRGRLLPLALLGYGISLAVGWIAGLPLASAGWISQPFLLGVIVSATSLGLVVAVLKDAGALSSPVGQTVVATSSVADFAAILALSLTFGGMTSDTGSRVVLLTGFAVAVLALAAVLTTSARSNRAAMVLTRLQDGTAEIRVRGSMVILVGCVVLAEHFGLETILGAFIAGILVGLVDRDTSTHPHFRLKLEAVGYGFLIPVFFVASGLQLDVDALFSSGSALARIPIFLGVLLLARGLPALLFLKDWGPRRTTAAALLQATSLPFIVTATQIGAELGLVTAETAAALVCAGLVSVLIFPVLATSLGLAEPSSARGPRNAETDRLVD